MKEIEKYLRETLLLLSMNKLLHIIDYEFQAQDASKCDLLIHLGFDSIQYAIIDKNKDELKTIAEYEINGNSSTSELIQAFGNLPECTNEFKYSFNKVKISFDSYLFTLIPEELFIKENVHQYAKFIENTLEADLLSKPIRAANIQNVFKIDSELHLILKNMFGDALIFNQANTFIQGIVKNYQHNNKSTLFLDVHEKHIQIALIDNYKFSFYNIFDCVNADELNYFLLNIIETLKIDVQNCRLMLAGNVVNTDVYYKRLEKYFNDIQFVDSELIVRCTGAFNELSKYRYFSLISIDQCE